MSDDAITCPPSEHTYGWQGRSGRVYCECGMALCWDMRVSDGSIYRCVRPAEHDGPHEDTFGGWWA